MFKKILTIFMLIIVVGVSLPYVAAPQAQAETTAEELKKERDELQQRLVDINKRLAGIKDDVKRAKEKAATYAERKRIVETQIRLLKEIIVIRTKELTDKQTELDAKVSEREETYDLFKQRIRAIYMNNTSSNLAALLGAESYTDFLIGSEMLRKVSEHDTALIQRLKDEEEIIIASKTVIEEDLTILEADKMDLDTKYNELAILYQEANAELSRAEALEQATQEDREAIIEEFERVNREWNEMMGNGSSESLGSGIYAWPVPGFSWISSGFGWRTLYGVPNNHKGIDIAGSGIYGTKIIAADTGRVASAVYGTAGYGYYVMVDHGNNNWTVYAHMSAIAVKVGDWVAQGDTLGYVGSTGNSTGPHLHFEVRINGVAVNPTDYVSYY